MLINKTPAEDFRIELKTMLKKAALQMGCAVEQLKYRFGNNGVVEIAIMDEGEMSKMEEDRIRKKNVKLIRKMRSMN